ncbi:MAG: hypothetical protein ACK4V4_10570 [Sphingobacteriales bacterium]|jgi:hypothetical protein
MDKRISTLIFIYVLYLITAVFMVLSTHGQKTMTMFLFGGGGILLLIVFYLVWVLSGRKS